MQILDLIFAGLGMMFGLVLALVWRRSFKSTLSPSLGWSAAHMGLVQRGTNGALESWWAALVAGGWLSLHSKATEQTAPKWLVVRGLAPPEDPHLRQVLQQLDPLTVVTTSWAFSRWKPLVVPLQTELQAQGLLPSSSQHQSRLAEIAVVSTLLALGLVLLGTLGWKWVGAVGFCFFSLVAAGMFSMLLSDVPWSTEAGKKALSFWRNRFASALRVPQQSTVGIAVALGGLAVLSQTPFAEAAQMKALSDGFSGGCGASFGGCGSSGCGGGGCGD